MKLLQIVLVVCLVGCAQLGLALPNEEASKQAQFTEQTTQSVNINTASADLLAEMLVGIGTRRAQAIVQYREDVGTFASLDDLMAVKGVGEKMIDANREKITFVD